jgi:osmotically-inducible protein OsmY
MEAAMRRDNRRAVIGLFLAVILLVAVGFWLSMDRTWPVSSVQQPVGTSGTVDVEKARERGAKVGETLAIATNKVAETAAEAAITAKVKAKMALDDNVKSRAIDVTTNNNTVTLRGKVGSVAEHDRALALARETDGVTHVNDAMTIDAR